MGEGLQVLYEHFTTHHFDCQSVFCFFGFCFVEFVEGKSTLGRVGGDLRRTAVRGEVRGVCRE